MARTAASTIKRTTQPWAAVNTATSLSLAASTGSGAVREPLFLRSTPDRFASLTSREFLHFLFHFASSAVSRIFASLLSWFSCNARRYSARAADIFPLSSNDTASQ